jgi:glycosyltransferase involved in cell wall biosynthesis
VNIVSVVALYPPTTNAGAELHLHSLLRDRVRRGDAATVLVLGPYFDPLTLSGVRVVPHSSMLDTPIDLVIGQLGGLDMAAQLSREAGRPLVGIAHSRQQVVHCQAAGAQLIVCNSRNVAEPLIGSAQDWCVCHPVVVCDDYQATQHQRNSLTRNRVTLVNMSDLKGAYQFYRLAERLPDTRFLGVIGGWDQQIIAPRPNVKIQDHTTDMRDVYSRTRVLLVPSRTETWGRVAAEAACCGIPTIGTPTDGLVECLDDAGIYLDRDDTDAWVEAIQCLEVAENHLCHSRLVRERSLALSVEAQADLDRTDRWLRAAAGLDPDTTTPVGAPVAGDGV